MDQVINLAIDAFPRNEDLFQEREVAIIIVDFALDERPDLSSRSRASRNVSQMVGDRSDLLIDTFFDQRNGFRRKHLCQRGLHLREVIDALADKRIYFSFKSFFVDQAAKTLFDEP